MRHDSFPLYKGGREGDFWDSAETGNYFHGRCPLEEGSEKGVIPITEATDTHDPTVKLIGFIDSCFGRPDASVPSDLLFEQIGD